MATSALAILFLFVAGCLILAGGAVPLIRAVRWFFGIPGRTVHAILAFRDERRRVEAETRRLRAEAAAAEERLKNEILRPLWGERPPAKKERTDGE